MTTMFWGFVGLTAMASSASFPCAKLVSTLVGMAASAGMAIFTSRARVSAARDGRARILGVRVFMAAPQAGPMGGPA